MDQSNFWGLYRSWNFQEKNPGLSTTNHEAWKLIPSMTLHRTYWDILLLSHQLIIIQTTEQIKSIFTQVFDEPCIDWWQNKYINCQLSLIWASDQPQKPQRQCMFPLCWRTCFWVWMPALMDSSRHGATAARIFSSVPIICTASWSDSIPSALNTTITGKSFTTQTSLLSSSVTC